MNYKLKESIKAVQWTGENHGEMYDFLTDGQKINQPIEPEGKHFYIDNRKVEGGLVIKGAVCDRLAHINDYIVKTHDGNFIPVLPQEFLAAHDMDEPIICIKDSDFVNTDYAKDLLNHGLIQMDTSEITFLSSINNVRDMVHDNAKKHGWWDGDERTFGDIVALCHSELSEALEEHRNGHAPTDVYFNEDRPFKAEGVPVELADTIIRILDYCGRMEIDIEGVIMQKHEYNKSRPYRHGNKVI